MRDSEAPDEPEDEDDERGVRIPQKTLTQEEQEALNKAMQDAIKNGSFT